MAVEYGMGPRQSAEEFCPYMTEIFYMNGNWSWKSQFFNLKTDNNN